jgi:hypothetical protein
MIPYFRIEHVMRLLWHWLSAVESEVDTAGFGVASWEVLWEVLHALCMWLVNLVRSVLDVQPPEATLLLFLFV